MHILITAGPTREYLDPVRYISNSSSGRMGYAIAQAARRRGHKVTLISGPVQISPPKGVKLISVTSAEDMYRATMKIFPTADAVIMAAAVSDYTPARKSRYKLKKTEQKQIIELIPTRDILYHLGHRKKGNQVLVGFALEDRAGRDHALQKFSKKNLDAIVLNAPTALGSVRNRAEVYTREFEWQTWAPMSKNAMGRRLVFLTEKLHKLAQSTE